MKYSKQFIIFISFASIFEFSNSNLNDKNLENILEKLNSTNFEDLNFEDPNLVQNFANSLNENGQFGKIDENWLMEVLEGPKKYFQEKCANVSGDEEVFQNAYVSF
jgi:hypothetical protein